MNWLILCTIVLFIDLDRIHLKIFYTNHIDGFLSVPSKMSSWDDFYITHFHSVQNQYGFDFFQLFTQTVITWYGMNRNWNSWYDLRGQPADFSTSTKYYETWFMVSSYGRINWRYQQTAKQFWIIIVEYKFKLQWWQKET